MKKQYTDISITPVFVQIHSVIATSTTVGGENTYGLGFDNDETSDEKDIL